VIALIATETHVRTYVLYYTTPRQIVKHFRRFAPPPYIPIAKARGFTEGIGKEFHLVN